MEELLEKGFVEKGLVPEFTSDNIADRLDRLATHLDREGAKRRRPPNRLKLYCAFSALLLLETELGRIPPKLNDESYGLAETVYEAVTGEHDEKWEWPCRKVFENRTWIVDSTWHLFWDAAVLRKLPPF
jgi:hypothetical protein